MFPTTASCLTNDTRLFALLPRGWARVRMTDDTPRPLPLPLLEGPHIESPDIGCHVDCPWLIVNCATIMSDAELNAGLSPEGPTFYLGVLTNAPAHTPTDIYTRPVMLPANLIYL